MQSEKNQRKYVDISKVGRLVESQSRKVQKHLFIFQDGIFGSSLLSGKSVNRNRKSAVRGREKVRVRRAERTKRRHRNSGPNFEATLSRTQRNSGF